MNLENEFIPYEQALALKELGFDQPCLAWTVPNNENFIISQCKEYLGGEELMTQIPLYQQCFRWFREKYSFYVIIKPSINNDFTCVIWTSKAQYHIGFFLSYEEAELACLVYLIDIVRKYIPIEEFNV